MSPAGRSGGWGFFARACCQIALAVSISLIFVIPAGVGAGMVCPSNAVLPPIDIGSCFRRNDGTI